MYIYSKCNHRRSNEIKFRWKSHANRICYIFIFFCYFRICTAIVVKSETMVFIVVGLSVVSVRHNFQIYTYYDLLLHLYQKTWKFDDQSQYSHCSSNRFLSTGHFFHSNLNFWHFPWQRRDGNVPFLSRGHNKFINSNLNTRI